MKVKRYLANDMNEAMIKIRHELGRDAVILHSRKIKKPGLFSWFSRPMIEVVAAVDEPDTTPVKVKEPVRKEPEPPVVAVAEKPAAMPNPEIEILKEQMSSIQTILSGILSKEAAQPPATAAAQMPEALAAEKRTAPESGDDYFLQLLQEADITGDHIARIMETAGRQISLTQDNEKAARNALRIALKDQLGAPYTIGSEASAQRICFFVGPTGVGKTTTLAKLAARLSLIDNRSVGLITADTFRIAAVDQLKTYSEILGIPLTVIYEAEEVRDAIQKYKDKDYILVDTAGRSHKNEEMQADLATLISKVESPEIFLVISLTTGYKDVISILDSYRFLGDYKLLFTKLDEAGSVGNILNIRIASGKPLSYFTIGQSVPDDIEVADADKVARRLLGEQP